MNPGEFDQVSLHLAASIPLSAGLGLSGSRSNPNEARYIRITDIDENGSLRSDIFASQPLDLIGDCDVEEGDILLAAAGGTAGKSYLHRESEGEFCYAGYLVRFRPNREIVDPRFIYYWTGSSHYWDQVLTSAVTSTIMNVSASRYSNFEVLIPPLETQQRIADYLDRETAEIDATVADLDRYVKLLEKRRRRVVIQGFNDPKYNPVSQRLKFLTASEDHRRIPIKSGDRVDMAGEFPYYGASGIIDYVNDYLWDDEKRLLLSEDGANLVMRNHPVAFVADGQYWVNNHAHVLKCRGETPPELVAKAIEVTSIAHLITGSAQPKLTAAAMGEIEFLFPLSVPDQKALLADLQPEMEEIDALIAESTKLRDLLLKRRSVLITEVVTGRKQV